MIFNQLLYSIHLSDLPSINSMHSPLVMLGFGGIYVRRSPPSTLVENAFYPLQINEDM